MSYTVLSLSLPLHLTIDNYQHRADVRKALTLDNNWNECLSKIHPMFISQVSCALLKISIKDKFIINLHHFLTTLDKCHTECLPMVQVEVGAKERI